jgi:DNA-binding CsgD family transcriptional regulator/PAS domain-containing protein
VDDREVEQLLALTSDIYDAALDPNLWPETLQSICAFVGVSQANLFAQDIESRQPLLTYSWNTDPHYARLYFEKYYKLNPMFPAGSFMEVGKVHSPSDLVPEDELQQSRFYQEWVRPQGLIDALAVNLEKTDTRSATFALQVSEEDGRPTEAMRRRLELLVPHIRKAVAIGQVIEGHATHAAALTDTLDVLNAAVFLTDATGAIIFANSSGRSALALGSVAREAAGRLVLTDAKANQVLLDALALSAKGDSALGIKGLAIPIAAANGAPWTANVLPLTSGARRRAGASAAATAAVFVRTAGLHTPSAMEKMARTYGLTPGEIRVLHGLVEVGGVPATAEALGISETTVKTHLKNLFEKTGVNRQGDLIKLVASASDQLG